MSNFREFGKFGYEMYHSNVTLYNEDGCVGFINNFGDNGYYYSPEYYNNIDEAEKACFNDYVSEICEKLGYEYGSDSYIDSEVDYIANYCLASCNISVIWKQEQNEDDE